MINLTIRNMAAECRSLKQYRELCRECGTDIWAEEAAILAVTDGSLPDFACDVRDGGMTTTKYWKWLADQTVSAQEAHDLEVQACYADDATY